MDTSQRADSLGRWLRLGPSSRGRGRTLVRQTLEQSRTRACAGSRGVLHDRQSAQTSQGGPCVGVQIKHRVPDRSHRGHAGVPRTGWHAGPYCPSGSPRACCPRVVRGPDGDATRASVRRRSGLEVEQVVAAVQLEQPRLPFTDSVGDAVGGRVHPRRSARYIRLESSPAPPLGGGMARRSPGVSTWSPRPRPCLARYRRRLVVIWRAIQSLGGE